MTALSSAVPRPWPVPAVAGLSAFAAVAIGLGAGRAITTTYVPVLLERIADRPGLIGAVMLVNAIAGFLVPLVTGLWSDRRGRRAPFIVGGSLVAAGGLIAVALGNASSYAVLALAAATVYIGLNAASTAHRTLVTEHFDEGRRAAATGAQEGAMLAGALLGTVLGGALISRSATGLFVLWAVLLPLLALPTLAWKHRTPRVDAGAAEDAHTGAPVRLLREVLRRDGARHVLVAQVLWVGSYAALTPFMVLYAEHALGLGAGAAGALLATFGVLTGVGMVVGARRPPEQLGRVLALGVALLGGGLLAATAAANVAQAALPFSAAAFGAGLVSSVGFPYFSRFIPDGQAGRYAGAFFSARAIATTAALPVAGVMIQVTGSYRALPAMGALGLAALIPLARAERRPAAVAPAAIVRPPIERLVAVMPVHRSDRLNDVVLETLRHVDHLVLVDDGAPAELLPALDALGRRDGVELLALDGNQGKGTAVAVGVSAALERAPDAVVVLDADGQHPATLIPAFAEAAAGADVVIGDRRHDAAAMPRTRRVANAISSGTLSLVVRRRLPDSQNGMRLMRTEALREAPPVKGRYEAETRHLKALVATGQEIAWVPMPAIYDGEPSSFRPVVDGARVMRAVLTRGSDDARDATVATGRTPLPEVAREWAPRLLLGMLFAWVVAAGFPVLAGPDEQLFLAVNGLGDGPEWLYQVLDPHSRNYAVLAALAAAALLVTTRRIRFAAGALLAMVLAAVVADLVMEIVQLGIDRPRPEEALGVDATRSHDRSWARIPSFPSGHLMVTAALVAAAAAMAPRLRWLLLGYLAAVAVTRVLFGAHFPLDVAVGALVGWQVGLFAVALTRAGGLLPAAAPRTAVPVPQPAPAHAT